MVGGQPLSLGHHDMLPRAVPRPKGDGPVAPAPRWGATVGVTGGRETIPPIDSPFFFGGGGVGWVLFHSIHGGFLGVGLFCWAPRVF